MAKDNIFSNVMSGVGDVLLEIGRPGYGQRQQQIEAGQAQQDLNNLLTLAKATQPDSQEYQAIVGQILQHPSFQALKGKLGGGPTGAGAPGAGPGVFDFNMPETPGQEKTQRQLDYMDILEGKKKAGTATERELKEFSRMMTGGSLVNIYQGQASSDYETVKATVDQLNLKDPKGEYTWDVGMDSRNNYVPKRVKREKTPEEKAELSQRETQAMRDRRARIDEEIQGKKSEDKSSGLLKKMFPHQARAFEMMKGKTKGRTIPMPGQTEYKAQPGKRYAVGSSEEIALRPIIQSMPRSAVLSIHPLPTERKHKIYDRLNAIGIERWKQLSPKERQNTVRRIIEGKSVEKQKSPYPAYPDAVLGEDGLWRVRRDGITYQIHEKEK